MQCLNKHKSALSVDLIQEVWCSCCMSPEKLTTYFHFKQQNMAVKHKNGGVSVTLYVFSNITEQSREDMSWNWTHTLMHSDHKDAENWIRPFSPVCPCEPKCFIIWGLLDHSIRQLAHYGKCTSSSRARCGQVQAELVYGVASFGRARRTGQLLSIYWKHLASCQIWNMWSRASPSSILLLLEYF